MAQATENKATSTGNIDSSLKEGNWIEKWNPEDERFWENGGKKSPFEI